MLLPMSFPYPDAGLADGRVSPVNCPPKVGRRSNLRGGGGYMAKYDENFRLKVVRQYLSGSGGSKAIVPPVMDLIMRR